LYKGEQRRNIFIPNYFVRSPIYLKNIGIYACSRLNQGAIKPANRASVDVTALATYRWLHKLKSRLMQVSRGGMPSA